MHFPTGASPPKNKKGSRQHQVIFCSHSSLNRNIIKLPNQKMGTETQTDTIHANRYRLDSASEKDCKPYKTIINLFKN